MDDFCLDLSGHDEILIIVLKIGKCIGIKERSTASYTQLVSYADNSTTVEPKEVYCNNLQPPQIYVHLDWEFKSTVNEDELCDVFNFFFINVSNVFFFGVSLLWRFDQWLLILNRTCQPVNKSIHS